MNYKKKTIVISVVLYILITGMLATAMYLNCSPNYKIKEDIINNLDLDYDKVKKIEKTYCDLHVQCKQAKFFKKGLSSSDTSDMIMKYLMKEAEFYPVGSKQISELLDLCSPFYCEAKYHLEVTYFFTISMDFDSSKELVVDDTYYKLIGDIQKSLKNVKKNYCQKVINFSYLIDAIIIFAWTIIYFSFTKRVICRNGDSSPKNISDKNRINTENEIMYCRKCGYKIPSDSQYCEKCGTKLH